MTIEESQQDIIDQFADIDDWMDRYAYIIDMGNALEPLPENLKTPDRLIEVEVLSGHTPDEILGADLRFINEIGLAEHLSPTRSNGLLAMLKQMRAYAAAFKARTA